MSMEYCHYCDKMIDTDFNAEHFILDADNFAIDTCIIEEQDKQDKKLEMLGFALEAIK